MPSIGELFVTLGAKTDASLTEALKKLQGLGTAAKLSAQMINAAARQSLGGWGALSRELNTVEGEFKQVGNAAKNTAREVSGAAKAARQSLESLRVANLAARSGGRGAGVNWGAVGDPFNPQAQRNAIRELQANLGPKINRARSAGNDAMEDMWAALSGQPRGTSEVPLLKRGNSWSSFLAGAPQDNRQYVAESIAGGGVGRKIGGARSSGGGRAGGRSGGGSRFGGPLGEAASIRRMVLGAGLYQGVEFLAGISDQYTTINNRLRQVTSSQKELNDTYDRLSSIALKTRSSLKTTSEAYVRIKMATSSLKLSQENQFKLIERINMAFKTSGANTQEASSGMIQLTQAFNKGKLDGDEFRTMAEEMPNVLDALAKTLHKPKDQLYALSRQGKLTRDVLVKAFLNDKDLETAFGKTTATFAEQWENLKTTITKPIGEALSRPEVQEAVKVVFEALAKLIVLLAKALPPVIKGITAFVKGLADGKPWAIGLAIALGTMLLPQLIAMVLWMGRMAAMPFTMIIGQIGKIKALMGGDFKGAGLNTNILGGGAGGAGSVGRGAGAIPGGMGGLAGLAAAAPPIAAGMMAINAADPDSGNEKYFGALRFLPGFSSLVNGKSGIGNFLTGSGGGSSSWMFDKASAYTKGTPENTNLQNLAAAQRANGATITVGPTTVTIYAKDGKDAAEQFTQEMVDRMMRHAAASVNRPGS